MAQLFEVGDSIKGDRLVAEARKLGKIKVIAKSGRHQAQQIVLWENAFCMVEKKLRFVQ